MEKTRITMRRRRTKKETTTTITIIKTLKSLIL